MYCMPFSSTQACRHRLRWLPVDSKIPVRVHRRNTLLRPYESFSGHLGCVRLGNLDLDFKIRISDLQSNAKSENGFQRWDICFWIFIFTVRLGNPKKGFEKLSLRTAVLHAHAYLAKRRPLFTRIVLQILFRIFQSNGKKEIHEIRIWIS